MTKSLYILPIFLAAATALMCARGGGGGSTFIPASHPQIRYTGRFDRSSQDTVRFDWPGGAVELRFGGTSCAVRVRGDGGLYNVAVNGKLSVVRFDTTETVLTLAENLRHSAVHHLKIVKRFEGARGRINTLKGFYIDAGESLHELPPRPPRRIEFIGGSSLLGFGVEADTVHCDTPAVYSNTYAAYGYNAARELGAEAHIVAMSGKGMARNWRTPFFTAKQPFGHFYGRALRNDSLPTWDFGSWIPHVAVIGFGTNDFSTRPHTPEALFKALYRNFAQEIYARYPGVHIVCVTSAREPLRTYVRELVEVWREEGNDRIHFYSYAQIPQRLSGCDWHPNIEAQKNIGKELAEVMRPLFGF